MRACARLTDRLLPAINPSFPRKREFTGLTSWCSQNRRNPGWLGKAWCWPGILVHHHTKAPPITAIEARFERGSASMRRLEADSGSEEVDGLLNSIAVIVLQMLYWLRSDDACQWHQSGHISGAVARLGRSRMLPGPVWLGQGWSLLFLADSLQGSGPQTLS